MDALQSCETDKDDRGRRTKINVSAHAQENVIVIVELN